ncbi:SLBB domain-containing protein [candidate division KSB1 bacterium]|nr:SLBB domain-containing protein [candidate division KSB1 bacterium]
MNHIKSDVPELIQQQGGLKPDVSKQVSRHTGVAEADVYGVGSFFHLLSRSDKKLRVCTGLSCQMAGADKVLQAALDAGLPVEPCSCLAACDQPTAVLRDREVIPGVQVEEIKQTGGDWTKLKQEMSPGGKGWLGHIGPSVENDGDLAINLAGAPDWSGTALRMALTRSANHIIAIIKSSELQGRGGAGFPAHIKWQAVQSQSEPERYVVLNADEGEPGTFKDRELLMRRPDRIVEGLAIAAHAVGAKDVFLYLRGEFAYPKKSIELAIQQFRQRGLLADLRFHSHSGQGAYICGEETALLEALEGKRGMPRLKPPFPVEVGLWGKPTLIHNVETIACVPEIIKRGGDWFKNLGRTAAGTKLYCISGHVQKPGTYELPLGITLDELVESAGGYIGKLKAFCPGGASSGFLPADKRNIALDFQALAAVGSMLGSAGVIVLNDTVDMKWAVGQQLRFFEDESCGQCAPCRIGTRYLREAVNAELNGSATMHSPNLKFAEDVAWQMNEASICGLGQTASLALTSAMTYFPEDFQ